MPRKAKELSALDVKRLRHPGGKNNSSIAVGGVDGLLLQITPTGARSWLFRYRIDGHRHTMGLGPFPDVTLAGARERARSAREQIWKGIDPLLAKRASQVALSSSVRRSVTFADATKKFLEKKQHEFSSARYAKSYRSELERLAFPELADMPVDQIDRRDVLRVLSPIWTERTPTAKKLRGKIEGVLGWAMANGFCDGPNPAAWKGNLEHDLASASKLIRAKEQHQPALHIADAACWFEDLRRREGIAARALEFLALTAVRSKEVRGAVWSEIDRGKSLWVVPAERMKPGDGGVRREHRIPLSVQMLALLDDLPVFEGSPYVFPAARGGMLSDAALSACMKRISASRQGGYVDATSGRAATPHGLRSTFRDWCAERGVDRDLAEISLAHAVGSEVERAYRRSDMLERRRDLMARWGGFLNDESDFGSVVALNAR